MFAARLEIPVCFRGSWKFWSANCSAGIRFRRTGGLGPAFLGKVGAIVVMDERVGGRFPRLKISTGARFLEISARGMDRGDLQA